MTIKLYGHPISGHVHRAQLFLSLLGLPHEVVNVDLLNGEQKAPAFLAKNAFGQVPVLEDGEVTIADSNAILVYLALRYDPDARWLPRDPVGMADVQRWLSAAAGPLANGPSLLRASVLLKRPLDRARPEQVTKQLFEVLENALHARAWLVGERATIADLALYAYTSHAPEGGVSLAPYPSVRAWLARIEALPGFVGLQRAPAQVSVMRTPEPSAYHAGEQAVQARAGVRDRAERLGAMFRDFMPDQHRLFFEQLPFLVVGSLDADGFPWASLLFGRPGFVHAPDAHHLTVRARPAAQNPLAQAIATNAPVGVLGIQLHTRRRNRVNGRITSLSEGGFSLQVDQSFGNCPQYIAARTPGDLRAAPRTPQATHETALLSAAARACIAPADTCFIASASSDAPDAHDRREGVDVSHRGGRPGFVRVRDVDDARGRATVLSLPDFAGNNAFNTLGNLLRLPRAGLAFPCFDTGALLLVTGDAEVIFEGPELAAFHGAERLVHVRVRRGVLIADALPAGWSEAEAAPQVARTGSWSDVP